MPAGVDAQGTSRYFWFYHIIDRASPTGTFSSLEFDSDGTAHILYRDEPFATDRDDFALKYAEFDGVSPTLTLIASTANGQPALALDDNDTPHIVYLDRENRIFNYARRDGGAWVSQEFDSWIRDVGFLYDNAIRVDQAGLVHLAYTRDYNGGGNQPTITYRTLENGEFSAPVWVDSLNISTGNGKWHTMILNDRMQPVIAYYAFDFADLGFAIFEDGRWRHESIEENNFDQSQGYYASIQQASNGDYLIAFQNWTRDKLRLARGRFGDWQIEDVVDLAIEGTEGNKEFTTPNPLVLDSDDNPYIAYYDSLNSSLKLAYNTGSGWQIETVDAGGDVGEHASLALTPDGLPAISYYDRTNGYLRYAVASLTPPADTDGDAIPDYLETAAGYDAADRDTDDDGLADGEEDRNGNGTVDANETSPVMADTDGDGLSDGLERGRVRGIEGSGDIRGTNPSLFRADADSTSTTDPAVADSDGDGLSDGVEDANANGAVDGLEPDPNASDTDGDLLDDGIELQLGGSPVDLDSDDDGLADGDEDANRNGTVDAGETHPARFDSDEDGIGDGVEAGLQNPIADPDGEGRLTATDAAVFIADADPGTTTDPVRADSDADGLADGAEDTNANGSREPGESDPLDEDTDGDMVRDGAEIALSSNPLDRDSDDDGILDGLEDSDGDGVISGAETSPSRFDSDGDGVGDGVELGLTVGIADPDADGPLLGSDPAVFQADADPTVNSNPASADSDSDGLSEGEEDLNRDGAVDAGETHFLIADSDGDGLVDGEEVFFLSNPLDSSSTAQLDTLLADKFSTSATPGWIPVDEGDNEGPSDWFAAEGALVQTSNIWGGADSLDERQDPHKPGTYLWRTDLNARKFRLSLTLRSSDDDELGVMFNYSDRDNYYRFSTNRQLGYNRLVLRENGRSRILFSDAFEYEPGRDYMLRIYNIGGAIQVHLDGRRVVGVIDSTLEGGSIALYCWRNAGATFRDIRVLGEGESRIAGPLVSSFALSRKFARNRLRWQIRSEADITATDLFAEFADTSRLIATFSVRPNGDGRAIEGMFEDTPTRPGLEAYRLVVRNAAGQLLEQRVLQIEAAVVTGFEFLPVFPNPSSGALSLTFKASRAVSIEYRIYDMLGREVRSVPEQMVSAGWNELVWDGLNETGRAVAPGTYFLRAVLRDADRRGRVISEFSRRFVRIR